MNIRKSFGGILILISIGLSMRNIISAKITGAVVGTNLESSILALLSLMFFSMGLIFTSNLEEKISKWTKAAAIAGTIGVLSLPAYLGKTEKTEKNIEYSSEISDEVNIVSPISTTQGRFERTYRWDRILDEAEEKYELPKGILKGLAMRESYGDPLKLNASNDGGAGLFMFQPRTAKHYGLKVHGTSDRSSADENHGKELRELIKAFNYDYGKLSKVDERFDVRKSAEAAAKYLKNDFKRYGSWDKALSAYNQGRPAPNASETKHVKAVNEYTDYYNQRDEKDKKYYTRLDLYEQEQALKNLEKAKKSSKKLDKSRNKRR